MFVDRAHDVAAFRAARDWAARHGHEQPDDRMLKAYGRALLARLGRCDATGPVAPEQTPLVCELPNSHGGWHRDGVTEWTNAEPAETRTEYGVRITFDDGHTEDQSVHALYAAESRVEFHRKRRADVPGWRAAKAEVIYRTVTTAGWSLLVAGDRPGEPR